MSPRSGEPNPVVNQTSANASNSVRNYAGFLEFCGLLALSFPLWWQPLTSTLRLALGDGAHTHILLIVPLSIALAYIKMKGTPFPPANKKWIGALLLSIALLLRGFTAWNIAHLSASNGLSLSMFAVVMWWIGSVIICCGVPAFRTLLFPICFLFLVVPWPESTLNWVTEMLQHQSAVGAELLFRAARVPVVRDGVVLSIPELDIEVARECSSIRSSTMLIVATLVLAQLFLRSWWRQTLLVVIAIPLSVAKNAFRIFTIAELGTRVDPGYLNGRLHHQGGIVFLSLALIVVVFLVWMLRSGEVRIARATSVES